MHYRLYAPADFDAIYAIEEACFQPPFRFSREHMHKIVSSSGTATWIAEQDDVMAGFAIVEWEDGMYRPIAFIHTLEVLPAHRSHGVGAQLLDYIESSARAAGARSIWLHVDAENDPAFRLYRNHGYISHGWEDHYYPEGRAALGLFKWI